MLEKDIVKHLVNNWKDIFKNNFHYCKKEYEYVNGNICDILAYTNKTIDGIEHKCPVLVEVKLDNDRDTLLHLNHMCNFKNRMKNIHKSEVPVYTCLITTDKTLKEESVINFCKENKVRIIKYIVDNDIKNFKLI